MNSAELFVKCLENEGVTHIFGLPGEENAQVLLALEKSSITFVLCRHEQGAAFMADCYARLTGKPGVCLSTLGPGATNLMTGVADANMDRVPLVAITAQADSHRLHKESHQNLDIISVFRPITKWAAEIIHPELIPEITRKAFKKAIEDKPGACLIELPSDIASMEVQEDIFPLKAENPIRPVPDQGVIARAAILIKKSRKPVILAGNGVIRENAHPELRSFAEKTGIGVTGTFMAKGAVPKSSDQCLFTIGLEARDFEWLILREADLVITAGYDFVEYSPRHWNVHGNGKKRKIIHIDTSSAEIDSFYQPDIEVTGDIAEGFRLLSDLLERDTPDFDLSFQKEIRKKIIEDIEACGSLRQKNLISPQKILYEVNKYLTSEDILISDVGAHKLWIARHYHAENPRTCIIPNGFCPMGFALPGSIGAKMAFPDKRVLAISGDGGFLMNVQELETAARMKTSPVIMVWEDGEYGLIRWKQDNSFGHHTNLSFNNPDLVELARAFGCYGVRITDSDNLIPELDKAFRSGIPAVISIPVDYGENARLSQHLRDIAIKWPPGV